MVQSRSIAFVIFVFRKLSWAFRQRVVDITSGPGCFLRRSHSLQALCGLHQIDFWFCLKLREFNGMTMYSKHIHVCYSVVICVKLMPKMLTTDDQIAVKHTHDPQASNWNDNHWSGTENGQRSLKHTLQKVFLIRVLLVFASRFCMVFFCWRNTHNRGDIISDMHTGHCVVWSCFRGWWGYIEQVSELALW